jgi:hypothetical protein
MMLNKLRLKYIVTLNETFAIIATAVSTCEPCKPMQTACFVMIIIFWKMTPCGSYKNRRFGESYRFHLQGARVEAGYRAKL